MKVLVLIARGLQLSYIGAYGNDWLDTPGLDRLAAGGIVFDQHIAEAPCPLGARRSWRSGQYHLQSPNVPTAEPTPDLFQLLREQGVVTALVSDGSQPLPPDFALGWDHVKIVKPKKGATALEATLEAVPAALKRLSKREHWLLWVELATLLPPWEVPEDFCNRFFTNDTETDDPEEESDAAPLQPLVNPPTGFLEVPSDETFQRLQNTYAAAVAYFDAGIELLWEALEQRGLLEDLLLVVMADRGLPLGEHGIVGDFRPWLHDELIHVPLLMRLPGGAEAGRRIAALTQAVDLMPTLLDAFGVPHAATHGSSLLPLARGTAEQVRSYAVAALSDGERMEWALRPVDWAFLLPVGQAVDDAPRPAQLYVKPDDRCEVNNLLQHHQEWVEQLERVLRDFVAATQRPGVLQAPEFPSGEC